MLQEPPSWEQQFLFTMFAMGGDDTVRGEGEVPFPKHSLNESGNMLYPEHRAAESTRLGQMQPQHL